MKKLKKALLFNRTTQNQYTRQLIRARNTFLIILCDLILFQIAGSRLFFQFVVVVVVVVGGY